MIQLRMGREGVPNAATFAQHRDGEAFTWSDLELRETPDGQAPVVYVGRGSHASFASAGEHWPMWPLPYPDYSDGKGPSIRPALEVLSDGEPGWVIWPGKWGSSDSSPDRAGSEGAVARSDRVSRRGAAARRAVVSGKRAKPTPMRSCAAGTLVTHRAARDRAVIRYEFPKPLPAGAARPERLVVSIDTPDDDLPPASHAFTVRATGTGVVAHPCGSRTSITSCADRRLQRGGRRERGRRDGARPRADAVSEEHFDAVVVGSGFGGSVAAFRLAEAGMRVCLLERGKAYPPGSFPRSPAAMGRNLWDPSEGLHGLFNVWEFRGLGGIVASGLGGGSLLYSNILIRKDASTFVQEDLTQGGWEHWPVTYEDLEPHYERHETMLAAAPYPFDRSPYDRTPKTSALRMPPRRSGSSGTCRSSPSPSASRRREPGPASPSSASTRTSTVAPARPAGSAGSATSGATTAASTRSTSTTSRSRSFGTASTSGRAARRRRWPRPGGGYAVRYVDHSQAVEGEERQAPLPEQTLTCDRLVLSAGTFGSTYLLAQEPRELPRAQRAAGDAFLRQRRPAHVRDADTRDGGRGAPRTAHRARLRAGDHEHDSFEGRARGRHRRAYYVQDGGYPETINWLIDLSDQPAGIVRMFRLLWRLIKLWLRLGGSSDIGADVARFIGRGPLSSTTLPLFAMGRDVPDGTMRLTGMGCSTSTGTSAARIRRSKTCGARVARSRVSSTAGSRTTCPGTSVA